MSNKNKKQIVFIEPKPTVYTYRIARSLKLTQKYETILVSFSEVDRDFFGKAYDQILILELSHKFNRNFLKTSIDFFKKVFDKKGGNFFKKIKKMNPYIFQITGPDLFSLITILFLRKNKRPKIYYSNDLWGMDKRNFFFTREFWIKGEIQKFCEKMCFRRVDGALNKMSIKEFDLLNYKLNISKMALAPSCLNEWTFPPKEKENKEIGIVYAASPIHSLGVGEVPFMKMMKIITSQKIHLHTYGSCINEKDNLIYIEESKKNKYYHYHEKVKPNILNKEMSKYDYGIFLYFMDPSKINLFPKGEKELMAAKMINYLEAGLPVILNKEYNYMTDMTKKYNIGFAIEFKDLNNLKEILKQKNYANLQKNVKKYQQEFKLSNRIKEIEEFYDKIVKMKKNSF
jgi:hypothetical protein